MHDFERYRRCSTLSSLPHYSWGDRSVPMAVSHITRSNMRVCPTRPHRNVPPLDPEPESNNGQPRRRIAVACARCRKRKIRCSGDPGDNTGCQNCRAAGADISACQFNRVGSYVPAPTVFPFPISSSPGLAPSSMYHGHSTDCSYAAHPKGLLSMRTYPNYSPVSYADDSSTDTYPYQSMSFPGTDIYSTGFIGSVQEPARSWPSVGQKQPSMSNIYLEEPSAASYSNMQLPYFSAAPVTRQTAVAADNISTFNMNSLQSSLTSPATASHAPLSSSLENRQLPIPTAARMPINPPSELRLRAQSASSTNAVSYTKSPALPWGSVDPAAQENRQPITVSVPSGQLLGSSDVKSSSASSLHDASVVGYIPMTHPSPDNSSNPSNSTVYTPSSLSGATTSSMDDKYSSSGSNVIPSSSSSRDDGLSRSHSTTNLSYYGTDNLSSKRNSSVDQSSQEGALVSGQRYTPLPPQSRHTCASLEQLRRNSLDHHGARPSHRTSLSSLEKARF